MANEEHVKILKQGVDTWNQWRAEHPSIPPDLSNSDLNKIDLSHANLAGVNLFSAFLIDAVLLKADLTGSYVRSTVMMNATLSGASLENTFGFGAVFIGADLIDVNFDRANMTFGQFPFARITRCSFSGTDLSHAIMGGCSFGDVDLSQVRGLELVQHQFPSFIDIQSVYRSNGKIPEAFLRGAGVPDDFIVTMRSIARSTPRLYSCFISHSSRDQGFAERIHTDLQASGVRCWFAPEEMKIGDRIRPRIDESISLHDKLLLVLSEHSIASGWVEQEVETALERERRHSKAVLFPIRLDDTVMEVEKGWPALIRNTRHIGDFTRWRDHNAYQAAFGRLFRDLKADGG